ncbi:hypothetical protein [Aeromicrobium stalagmiti]|uniref:hypothetical protein n=1 Tax=Aeromicrobium stalagmiti TaxID=2738988 RepID=UPI0015693DE4|nr:hypothetical protein [Aeromicrobium stalagmiti]NRQ51557.1 hypothetical protein [Aeromicrobium stalagmiti]
MKWLIRIGASVLIAGLVLTMWQGPNSAKGAAIGIAAIMYIVARFEGIDVRNFWGYDDDDDDDGQGPLRPA